MKNINKTTAILILVIAGILFWAHTYIMGMKEALAEANKPSKIEMQELQLKELEEEWKVYEDKKAYCTNTIKVMEENKSEVEPKIQKLRKDMVGLN